MSTGTEDPEIAAAQTFVEYFVIEDEDGSILKGDLYYAYVVWTAQQRHETVSERQFFELLVEQVSFDTAAMTSDMEWVQRLDGLAISLVDAF